VGGVSPESVEFVRKASPGWILLLLFALTFSLATMIQPRAVAWSDRGQTQSLLGALLGNSRRLFANHFLVKADVYFHSGYYPSIFDQAASASPGSGPMLSAHSSHEDEEHEKEEDFLGPPRDWIERFGRHFMITTHTHLENGNEREILPWLKISAELDPQRVDTYTVAAYWLRTHLGKPNEAEAFLREGERENPNSYEILFELGRLYRENFHQDLRARNVWELALKKWREQETNKPNPNNLALDQIAANLARVEEDQGNYQKAIDYLEIARKVSPAAGPLGKEIEELKAKLAGQPKGK
jgi:tetratricopeptide (TPR) repeat protein